jgi:hypothetical protein
MRRISPVGEGRLYWSSALVVRSWGSTTAMVPKGALHFSRVGAAPVEPSVPAPPVIGPPPWPGFMSVIP